MLVSTDCELLPKKGSTEFNKGVQPMVLNVLHLDETVAVLMMPVELEDEAGTLTE